MSLVTVQLGQCGNQTGGALFRSLFDAATSAELRAFQDDVLDCFFKERHSKRSRTVFRARALLIDMEPKVINAVMREVHAAEASSSVGGSSWHYGPDSHFAQDSGAGNNWACGFFSYGPRCHDAIMDIVRREVEACDCFGGFLTLQSMAGGTGAGLGAYMINQLREEYPSANILSHCVWPFESGEVSVQSYNTMLTLRHLADSADGIVVVENDALASVCRRLLHIQRPAFGDMNKVAARGLSSILLPAHWRSCRPCKGGAGSIATPGHRVRVLADIIDSLCGHPGYSLLSLRTIPQMPVASVNFTTFTWPALLKRLRQMLLSGALLDDTSVSDWCSSSAPSPSQTSAPSIPTLQTAPFAKAPVTALTRQINRSVASLLVLRGLESGTADVSGFEDPALYAHWAVDPLRVAAQPVQLEQYQKSATLLSNSQSAAHPAQCTVQKAYEMYGSKAYLHQYTQHGMVERDFLEAFCTSEDIIARYQKL